MKRFRKQVMELQSRLDGCAEAGVKDWWERYLKGVITFRGVGIPGIRKILGPWRTDSGVDQWPVTMQFELALDLMESPIAEDKLAGILLIQDYLVDIIEWPMLIERSEKLYESGVIFDWNTSDWFCVRVLGPLIDLHGMPCARSVSRWRNAPDLWQARSSAVAFVKVASRPEFYPLVFDACAVLISREERFAGTGVGWILREISRYDENFTRLFIEKYLNRFTPESLKNASKYLSEDDSRLYLDKLRN